MFYLKVFHALAHSILKTTRDNYVLAYFETLSK